MHDSKSFNIPIESIARFQSRLLLIIFSFGSAFFCHILSQQKSNTYSYFALCHSCNRQVIQILIVYCVISDYRQKLTSPKWNSFKGIRLRWKDKIRLNNLIWRCWHMQCKLCLVAALSHQYLLLPLITV